MGKLIATYLVRVTLRELDDVAEGDPVIEVPTNEEMQVLVALGIKDTLAAGVTATIGSERVDE